MKHKTRVFWAYVCIYVSIVTWLAACAPQRPAAPVRSPAKAAPTTPATAAPVPSATEAADLWTPTAIPAPTATAQPPTLTPAPGSGEEHPGDTCAGDGRTADAGPGHGDTAAC